MKQKKMTQTKHKKWNELVEKEIKEKKVIIGTGIN